MEKPPKIKNLESKEGMEKGRNVTIEINLIRHAEKDGFYGKLSEKGKQDASDYGKDINSKVYHSPVTRAEETAQGIAESSLYTPRKREMLRTGFSEEFIQKYADITAKHGGDESEALQMYLDTDSERPDEETLSSREVSARLAGVLARFARISERLKNNSNVHITLVSHSGTIEHLLADVLKEDRKDFVKKKGGGLEFLEGAKFVIHRDESGESHFSVEFRGKKQEFDESLLKEISDI